MRRSGSGSWRASTIRSSRSEHSRPLAAGILSLAPEHIANPVVLVGVVRRPARKPHVRARLRRPLTVAIISRKGNCSIWISSGLQPRCSAHWACAYSASCRQCALADHHSVTRGKPWQAAYPASASCSSSEFGIESPRPPRQWAARQRCPAAQSVSSAGTGPAAPRPRRSGDQRPR